MPDQLRFAVIIGSTRHGRFGPTVADWIGGRMRRADVTVDLLDLAVLRLPSTLVDEDSPLPDPVRELAPRLAAADAFVVVTPEYNHSFPAPLKTLIDWYYAEWQAKPVGFVSYGRESGGLHAVAQLRQIFTELAAVPIRESVTLPNYWDHFAADGSWPKPTADCNATAAVLLDRLAWWAHTLRDARQVSEGGGRPTAYEHTDHGLPRAERLDFPASPGRR